MKKYDIIIIGGGVAALTAAIYCARKKLSTLILAKEIGGQTAWAAEIENYPGYEKIRGIELIMKMRKQVENLQVVIKEGEIVRGITGKSENFIVSTNVNKYNSRTIIIASGKEPRKLKVPGEEKFLGKGVAYCATCDVPLFHDKNLTVIGGGNSALGAATELSKYTKKKIYILERSDEFKADAILIDKLTHYTNVELITNAKVKEIKGNKFVEELIYLNTKNKKLTTIKVNGVFVEIGSITSANFCPTDLKRNKLGEIIIDQKTGATNMPGIFAAGDVTDCLYKQIVIAVSSGAIAAISVYEYLRRN